MFYDHLVTPEIRELVRRDAEMIRVGKRAGEIWHRSMRRIGCWSRRRKRAKTVVRLKGGDPFIFGRGGEELQAAAAAEIPSGCSRRDRSGGRDGVRRDPADPPRLRAERDLRHRPLQGG